MVSALLLSWNDIFMTIKCHFFIKTQNLYGFSITYIILVLHGFSITYNGGVQV